MNPLSGAILMMLLSSHGTAAVAAYGAAQRIESILILVLMSLTSALTPFMAQNLGAKILSALSLVCFSACVLLWCSKGLSS